MSGSRPAAAPPGRGTSTRTAPAGTSTPGGYDASGRRRGLRTGRPTLSGGSQRADRAGEAEHVREEVELHRVEREDVPTSSRGRRGEGEAPSLALLAGGCRVCVPRVGERESVRRDGGGQLRGRRGEQSAAGRIPLVDGDGEGRADEWRRPRPADHAASLPVLAWVGREGDAEAEARVHLTGGPKKAPRRLQEGSCSRPRTSGPMPLATVRAPSGSRPRGHAPRRLQEGSEKVPRREQA